MADQNEQNQQQGGQQPEQNADQKPKRNLKPIIFGVVAVALIVGGFFFLRSLGVEDTDDAQVDGNLYSVSSRVAGQVVHVYVQDAQIVQKGQLLAEIDPTDYQVAVEQAQAELANAKAELDQSNVNVPLTQVNVDTTRRTTGADAQASEDAVRQAEANAQAAQAKVQEAKATALKSQTDVDRYTPLVARDIISKQTYDQAVATAATNQATVVELERNAKAQQDAVGVAKQRLQQSIHQSEQAQRNAAGQVKVQAAKAQASAAQVQQAKAKLDQAELNLSYTKIVAPVAGIVNKKSVVEGANLTTGQSLLTIVPLDDLWVTANFKETQLKKMRPGMEVNVKVDALGGKEFKGVVRQIGGATGSSLSLFPPENATGNYVKVVQRIPVHIDFTDLASENKDHLLRVGMSVVPEVNLHSGK